MTDTVIIVGAPRSGTNMLRDVLTSLPGFGTWPCDEINLMWKHGNRDVDHDELTPDHARPEVVAFLRRKFDQQRRRRHADVLVEKTCATSLRVAFAAAVFPEAKFIFIRRDGLDAAASAMKRWNAPVDVRYTARKARYAPLTDLVAYGTQFVKSRTMRPSADRSRADTGQLRSWWGPKPHDYRSIQHHPLDEAALIQWQRCVESASADLRSLSDERVVEVRYEDFVAGPEAALTGILRRLDRPMTIPAHAVGAVTNSSVGKGRRALTSDSSKRLTALAACTLKACGYDT